MKNKKLTYVLIPLVLLVWGTIIYKIVKVANNDDDSSKMYKSTFMENEGNELLSDTFSIHPNYRDPFISKRTKGATSPENSIHSPATPNSNEINKSIALPSSSGRWPAIVYSGLIKNQKSNKQLALIQIDGKANIMKTGDIMEQIELTKIFRDSIEVKFYKEKKIIKR